MLLPGRMLLGLDKQVSNMVVLLSSMFCKSTQLKSCHQLTWPLAKSLLVRTKCLLVWTEYAKIHWRKKLRSGTTTNGRETKVLMTYRTLSQISACRHHQRTLSQTPGSSYPTILRQLRVRRTRPNHTTGATRRALSSLKRKRSRKESPESRRRKKHSRRIRSDDIHSTTVKSGSATHRESVILHPHLHQQVHSCDSIAQQMRCLTNTTWVCRCTCAVRVTGLRQGTQSESKGLFDAWFCAAPPTSTGVLGLVDDVGDWYAPGATAFLSLT
mmetsp:Transcript_31648/g.72697  ORF Transcript_31648/g.72697 Transcript_31648/m.72697 type:complete len:270 (-) Transcript_31648:1439-2248(-)